MNHQNKLRKQQIPLMLVLTLYLWQGVAWAESGTASYYTTASCQREGTSGVYTANGERYDENGLTCARPRRSDLGKVFVVYCPKTNKEVFVRCNDMGPNKKLLRQGRIIDVTPRVFKHLAGDLSAGLIEVEVQEVK